MRQGVTPIDQLINLDDENGTRDETLNKVKNRSIRNTGGRGGMSTYEKMYNTPPEPSPQMQGPPKTIINEEEEYRGGNFVTPGDQLRIRSTIGREGEFGRSDRMFDSYEDDQRFGGSCIDVAHHAHNCPVCSRLYNTDKTPYLVLIGLLVIICLILIKKVLEK